MVTVSSLAATGIIGAIVLCVAHDPILGFTQECLWDLCPAWGMYSLVDLLWHLLNSLLWLYTLLSFLLLAPQCPVDRALSGWCQPGSPLWYSRGPGYLYSAAGWSKWSLLLSLLILQG